jgi:hypothetical protein
MTEVESALRALSPAPSRLDRDRLMFKAGALARGQSGRLRWLWPSITAALAFIVAGESTMLVSRSAPRVIERLVIVNEPSPARAASTEPLVAVPSPPDRQAEALPGRLQANRFGEVWGDPSQATLPARWETVADAHHLQERMLGFAFDQLDGPRRVPISSGPAKDPLPRPASVGELRRLEIEKLLNPGDRS